MSLHRKSAFPALVEEEEDEEEEEPIVVGGKAAKKRNPVEATLFRLLGVAVLAISVAMLTAAVAVLLAAACFASFWREVYVASLRIAATRRRRNDETEWRSSNS